MTIMGALRRAYWAVRWKFQPIPIFRPEQDGFVVEVDTVSSYPALPPLNAHPSQLTIRYPMPPGGGWIKISDWSLNQQLQAQGDGWAGMCAVEVWREDYPKSSAVFSSWLMNLSREHAVGMYWRPLPHGRLIPMTVQ